MVSLLCLWSLIQTEHTVCITVDRKVFDVLTSSVLLRFLNLLFLQEVYKDFF